MELFVSSQLSSQVMGKNWCNQQVTKTFTEEEFY